MKILETCPTIVERIPANTDLLQALEDIVSAEKIDGGILQIIGALEKVNLGTYVDGKYKYVTYDGPIEIASGMGNITFKDGKPFVHCHLMVSDHEGHIFGGHLSPGCIVHPTAEVFITPMKPQIKRKFDEELNLWIMDV